MHDDAADFLSGYHAFVSGTHEAKTISIAFTCDVPAKQELAEQQQREQCRGVTRKAHESEETPQPRTALKVYTRRPSMMFSRVFKKNKIRLCVMHSLLLVWRHSSEPAAPVLLAWCAHPLGGTMCKNRVYDIPSQ